MFSKRFITIPLSKDLIFRGHSENRKRSLILSDAVAEITKLWEAELPDFLILINVVPGMSVVVRGLGQFLINVVAEITELWVENSQKINWRDVTSIREGRVSWNFQLS